MLLALAGCGSNKREETGGCKIWYMNQAETKLEAESKELQADTTDGQIRELIELLRDSPENEKLKPFCRKMSGSTTMNWKIISCILISRWNTRRCRGYMKYCAERLM